MAENYHRKIFQSITVYEMHLLVSLLEKFLKTDCSKGKSTYIHTYKQTDRQTLTVHSNKTIEDNNLSPVQL